MTPSFKRAMTKAAELTRSGKLQEATVLIQSLLHRPGPETNVPAAEPDPANAVIEGDFTRLDTDQPHSRAATLKAKPEGRKRYASATPLA